MLNADAIASSGDMVDAAAGGVKEALLQFRFVGSSANAPVNVEDARRVAAPLCLAQAVEEDAPIHRPPCRQLVAHRLEWNGGESRYEPRDDNKAVSGPRAA